MKIPKPEPVVLVDTREQAPLRITAFPVEVATLPVGDYGIKGFSDWARPEFIIERKSLDDLVGSLTAGRERFWKECEKLRQFRFRALVIEALPGEVEFHQYRSTVSPASIFGSLRALEVRHGIHVLWCKDADGAAHEVEGLVRVFIRGIEKDFRSLLATPEPEEVLV
jgi:ERCC4-type nuclease